ncbi:MAG TPA: transporter [Methylocella sp.]|nr:transporter [Methylocella sp.]
MIYLSVVRLKHTGRELGITLNMINTATDYQSGEELHFEAALNEHIPFGLAAGLGGYYYQQITPDGGSGDKIGAFMGRVAAIGPLLHVQSWGAGAHPKRPVVS